MFNLICLILLTAGAAVNAAEPKTLVIVGDSLTEGYGVSRDEAYPALLQKKITEAHRAWKVVNAGVSGSTSASAPARVKWVLKSKPDLVMIALGANDGLRGIPVPTVEDNLDRTLAACAEAKVRVLLAGMRVPPNYGVKYGVDLKAMFERLAKKHHAMLLPFLLDRVAGDVALNQTDGIHPNARGHAVVAETVYTALEKLL